MRVVRCDPAVLLLLLLLSVNRPMQQLTACYPLCGNALTATARTVARTGYGTMSSPVALSRRTHYSMGPCLAVVSIVGVLA